MTKNAILNLMAPANLNVFLHVLGQREDGKHRLESVFVLIDRSDTVSLFLDNENTITRTGDIIGEPEQDLCVRAARLLQKTYNVNKGCRIHVTKRIPAGAGMGGGSSDAATTLIGLTRLWDLKISRQALMQLGLQLGADVPFFIQGENAWVEGIGEIITPITFPNTHFEVIWPGVNVSTQKIFSAKNLTRDSKSIKIAFFARTDEIVAAALEGHNDLQPVACELEPRINEALQMLAPSQSPRMTGSGSAVFSISSQGEQTHFQSLPEGWVGFKTTSLKQHPLADWLDD